MDKVIEKYTIETAYAENKLTEKVNNRLVEGWVPLGGVSASLNGNGRGADAMYIQAMVKYKCKQ